MGTSVALCTYNGQSYVAQQLESILVQTRSVDEIIICDDGSTDGTIDIIKYYRKKYPTIIKLYTNSSQLGIIKNFERAINLCTKEIIFLCDQDDIWHENKVWRITQYFKDNKDKDAVFHNLRLMLNGQIISQTLWDIVYFYQECRVPEKLNWYLTYFNNVVTGAALAIRKPKEPVFIKTSSVKPKKGKLPFFLHDYLLALNYTPNNKLGILDECLIDYRIHQGQNSGLKLKRYSDLSPYKVYNSPNLSIRIWYINRRMRRLTPHTDLHIEISIALECLRKEKENLNKKLNPFLELIPIIKYIILKIYSIFDYYIRNLFDRNILIILLTLALG